jgi:uncharacterized protein
VLKKQAPVSNRRKARVPTPAAAPAAGRRVQKRRSGVHGQGVYAVQPLIEGETLMEYVGEVIDWPEALRRHPHNPADPNHTFYFHIDEDHVIDGNVGGNSSRWINHSCDPNCEADEQDGRVFIKALRDIAAGDELFYDYGLIIDAKYTPALLAEYPCWCGAASCRGTLLAPKEDKKKSKKKKAARKDAEKQKKKALKKAVEKAGQKLIKKAVERAAKSAFSSALASARENAAPGKLPNQL